jgi:glycosyltransferase involved in cell wall biosynthesis
MTTLSVVIPVYNAEKTIESLCKELISLYPTAYRLEIVLVDDCSRDNSHRICLQLHRTYPEIITYLRLSRNFGEHSAVMAGLNHVHGDYCVIMDDDFQNPPEEVGRLMAEAEKGYDVVYSSYPAKKDNLFRNFGSHFNNRIANYVLNKPTDLYLSSFKVINRFLVQEVIKYTGPDPYIDAIILRTTTNIGTLKIRHDKRRFGRSGYTLKKLVSLWGNMVVSYSLIPLRIIGVLGFIMTLIGLAMGGTTLVHALFPGGHDPNEYEKLTSVIAFFRGFQLLAISIVGEYVGRIYLTLNSDPQFVIRERLMAQTPDDRSSAKTAEVHPRVTGGV